MATRKPSPRSITLVLLTACVLASAPARAPDAAAEEPGVEERLRALEEAAKKEWRFEWRDGFRLRSPDGQLAFSFGGRLHYDWAFFSADPELEAAAGAFEDGTEIRRGRVYFAGTLHERFEFRTEYDFAGGQATARDVFVGLLGLPGVGAARAGHFKEPFSLEELHSTNFALFMEKSLPVEALAPSRNAGLMLHRSEERFSLAAGAFLETDDFARNADGDAWGFTARATALPWLREGGGGFLHLGLAASERSPTGEVARFRSRPDSHLAPRLIDSGTLPADSVRLVGVEAALVRGPWTVQAEHIVSSVDPPAGRSADLEGSYLAAAWLVTGESRPYRTSGAVYDRLRPARPLGTGPGAWEIAARWSDLDLSEVARGRAEDWTLGVNWYAYSNVRVMLNLVRAELESVGEVDIVQTRLQVDF